MIWLSVRFGISVPGYVLAIMAVTKKTNEGEILPLVTEPPVCYRNSTAKDQICDHAQPMCNGFIVDKAAIS